MSEVKIMQSKIDKMIQEEVTMLEENISMEQLRAVYEKRFKGPTDPNAQNPEGLAQVRFEMFVDGFSDGQETLKHDSGGSDRNFFGKNLDWAKSNMDNPVSKDYINGYDYATGNSAREDAEAVGIKLPEPENEMTPGRQQIADLVPELPVREASMRIAKSRVKEIIQEELDRFNAENF